MDLDHKQSLKEILRHVLVRSGTHGLLEAWRRRRGHANDHLTGGSPAERFQAIYDLGVWVKEDGQESRSGRGSEASSTRRLIHALPELLRTIGCKTLLDVGCGDWNWMAEVELPCDYVGIDIVPSVIKANQRHVRPGVCFALANAIEDPLPAADAVLCREMIFHLSFADGRAALRNICASTDWLITTTDRSIWFNSDIPTGDFRKINLERSPYRLPEPDRILDDSALSKGRILGVWRTARLAF